MKNDPTIFASASLLANSLPVTVDLPQDEFAVLRHLRVPFWIYDIDNARIVFANESACHMWQAKDESELLSRDLAQNMSAMVRRRLKQYQVDFIEHDAAFNEQWTLYPNDKPTSVMVVFKGFCLADGRVGMQCEVVGQSDTDPENLRSAEALLHTDVMITLYSVTGVVLYMNPAARNAATRSQHTLSELFLNSEDYENAISTVEQNGECRSVARVFTGSGARWHDISLKRCTDAVTGDPAFLVTAIDVSELKVARDKARFLADRDQLTGCYNRAFVQQYCETFSSEKDRECALIYIDVDNFKNINDGFGHEMGDAVLKHLVVRARKLIRSADLIARLGGDEFVILLHDVPSSEILFEKINDLQRAIAEPIYSAATHVDVTVSVGVATFELNETDFDKTLRNADVALYVSKQSGRNKVTYFDEEIGARVNERRLLEADIKRGLDENEFILHYQPRIDLKSGKVVSAEALARWDHPTRGLIMPDDFISVCEETGMIEVLGQSVIEMGCNQAIKWARDGVDLGVSINISPRQFQNDRMLKTLEDYASSPHFPQQKIELEITENVLIGDHELIAQKLHAITKLGYRIAIDDFGTGYSNLSYISRFPLNCIKIDRSFISQLPQSAPIIRLILTLAKQVNATAVAEGVETQAEYDWLRSENCDQIQGYYLSRPVPVGNILSTIAAVSEPLG
ncbi:MAG: diguanylate cyclase (GGDEF)-like protein [Yoonia sp.]|jgi:diguanylate cyclase (GGDEF)-like protein